MGCDNKIAVMNTITVHIKHCLEFHLLEPRVYLLELMAESESTIPAPKRPKRQHHLIQSGFRNFKKSERVPKVTHRTKSNISYYRIAKGHILDRSYLLYILDV